MAKQMNYLKTRNFCHYKCTEVTVNYDLSELIFSDEAMYEFNRVVRGRYAHSDVGRSSGSFYFAEDEDAFNFKLIFSSSPKDKYNKES